MTNDNTPRLSLAVLIATYKRPRDLERCLRALVAQAQPPDEVLVIVRDIDTATHAMVDSLAGTGLELPIRRVTVQAPGVVAARNAGLAVCRSDIVAIIDDDTVPYPDWTARIRARFLEDPRLGGLGGRDRCHDGTGFDDAQEHEVGKIQWFGRFIGNHHRGFGPMRDVDFLKGANMSFRVTALAGLRFDTRMRDYEPGHEDLGFSSTVRRAGWRVAYDPQILVDHYAGMREGQRHYVDVKSVGNQVVFASHAFNIVVAIWDNLSPARRVALMIWSFLVGTRICPGLAQAIRFTPRLSVESWRRFLITQRGLFAAFRLMTFGGVGGKAAFATMRQEDLVR